MAVKSVWIHSILSAIKRSSLKKEKTPKKSGKETVTTSLEKGVEIIKRLMDGFFDPWDLVRKGGTSSFKNDPVYLSLKCMYTYMIMNFFHITWLV